MIERCSILQEGAKGYLIVEMGPEDDSTPGESFVFKVEIDLAQGHGILSNLREQGFSKARRMLDELHRKYA